MPKPHLSMRTRWYLPKRKSALAEMLNWSSNSEIDLYPYVREVLTSLFGYSRDHIRLAERGSEGKMSHLFLRM